MFSGPSLITLIISALVGTVIGNLVQLRYFMDNKAMKSPFVRYGALILAIIIIFQVMPDDPNAVMTTNELLTYGLWWVLIAFLVSFLRPPAPLPPRGGADQADTDEPASTIHADGPIETRDTDPGETEAGSSEPGSRRP